MTPRKNPRDSMPRERIFLSLEEQPNGARIFVKRRRRKGNRGLSIGRANEREMALIRENHPDVLDLVKPPKKKAAARS